MTEIRQGNEAAIKSRLMRAQRAGKLENLVRHCQGKYSEEIVQRILHERFAFTDGLPQRDDMTLVVMRVLPQER